MASVSLAITVNTSPQLDLSKDRTFLGRILGWQLGRDCELPDATFASEDGQHSSAHKIVLISTRRRHHNNRLRILVFEVSHFYYPLPPPPQHHQYLVVLELMHNCVIVIDANETVKLMTVVVIQYESTKIAI